MIKWWQTYVTLIKKSWRLTFNPWRSTPVDSAQLMDCFFVFPTRVPELTLNISFMKAPCCIFFNTLILRVRNAEIYRLVRCHVTKILVSVVLFMAMRGLFPLQKRAHWKTLPVKRGVRITLCEQKRGFKDYRRFRSLMNLIVLNYSHTFKRECGNNRSRLPLF